MSFGWSAGDVIAGLKVVWDIWQAVAEGPLNAQFQAQQFFDEFQLISTRLEEWEKQRPKISKDDNLTKAHVRLKDQCTEFIKRHMALIQQAIPETKTKRVARSTWVRKVDFTKSQAVRLYQQVKWPAEQEAVTRLQKKLELFLDLSAWDMAWDTNKTVHSFGESHAELVASNLKLVSSHLELVSLINFNLRSMTEIEPGRELDEIDNQILHQLKQALRAPEPIGSIKEPPRQAALPWQSHDDAQLTPFSSQLAAHHDSLDSDSLLLQRLDNITTRMRRIKPLRTISEFSPSHSDDLAVQQLTSQLQHLRGQITDAVGVSNHQGPQNELRRLISEPESVLRLELEEWNLLEDRIERERLHPSRTLQPPPPAIMESSVLSRPIPIPGATRSPRSSGSLSPLMSGSPEFFRPLSSPPKHRRHSQTPSTTSVSRSPSFRLEYKIPVTMFCPNEPTGISGVIHSISRSANGDAQMNTFVSNDGSFKSRHSVDLEAPSPFETSMIPFLDNSHVDKHKYRVQFKGAHSIKITTPEKAVKYPCPPIYKFNNQDDYLLFQHLLLNKEVKTTKDILCIKSTEKETQCSIGTISLLYEPFSSTRHILYFRKTPDQKPGFVEWPVNLFKPPKSPPKTTLKLESNDNKPLSLSKRISRQNTQGSIATVRSFETSPELAFGRIQEKAAAGKGIKGLIVEFYDHDDCLEFWKEFVQKEVIFPDLPPAAMD